MKMQAYCCKIWTLSVDFVILGCSFKTFFNIFLLELKLAFIFFVFAWFLGKLTIVSHQPIIKHFVFVEERSFALPFPPPPLFFCLNTRSWQISYLPQSWNRFLDLSCFFDFRVSELHSPHNHGRCKQEQ